MSYSKTPTQLRVVFFVKGQARDFLLNSHHRE